MGKTLFITGATGYIGGTALPFIIHTLRTRLNVDNLTVKALVRTEAKEKKLLAWAKQRAIDLVPVRGSLSSKDLIVEAVASADYIVDTADCDDLQGAESLTDGLSLGISRGRFPIVIHTSGTNLLTDGADGERSTDQIVHDDKNQEINAIPDEAPHRNVDLHLLKFYEQNKGKLGLAIIAPPTIWGIGRGPDAYLSQQVPRLIKIALAHKQAYHVGHGLNTWCHIHVADLGNFYGILLDKLAADPEQYDGLFFCEAGSEFQWSEVSRQIQRGLYEIGLTDSLEAKGTTRETYDGVFFDSARYNYYGIVGGNSRVRAVRGRQMGWEPLYSTKQDFLNYIVDELYLLSRI
ncbi:hypothetical protein TRVA0_001S07184 [Trichomonascus vanleenenianus]|uniref:uncharacterized protein n=1 Tax=Trichomonascus vanleenenianus TaxID=2268995 RepID=UPI003ECAD355